MKEWCLIIYDEGKRTTDTEWYAAMPEAAKRYKQLAAEIHEGGDLEGGTVYFFHLVSGVETKSDGKTEIF